MSTMIDGRVSIDPAIMSGMPCIIGTRILVETLAGRSLLGFSLHSLTEMYPDISVEDVINAERFTVEARRRYANTGLSGLRSMRPGFFERAQPGEVR